MVTWPSKMLVCARYLRWCSIMPSDFSISTLKKVLKQAGISKSPRPRPVFPFESYEVEANDQYFHRGLVLFRLSLSQSCMWSKVFPFGCASPKRLSFRSSLPVFQFQSYLSPLYLMSCLLPKSLLLCSVRNSAV